MSVPVAPLRAVPRRLARLLLILLVAGGSSLGVGASAYAAPTDLTPVEQQVVDLVNAHRAAAGCTVPLVLEPRLTTAARLHSADMVARGYVSHISPDGANPFQRMAAQGYQSTWKGEVIGAGQTSSAEVVDGWLNSPPHRQALLDCRYRVTGVGLASGGSYGHYWTELFGDAVIAPPAPPVAPEPPRPPLSAGLSTY